MDSNDRKRQSQVQTKDLTESRINDDFVYWLKNSGRNYLTVLLLAAAATMLYLRWQRGNIEKSETAWKELASATLPEAFEQLAKDHAEVPRAAMVALIRAGDLRLQQLQSNTVTPAQGETPAVLLDDQSRKITQDAADENYAKAGEIAVKLAGGDRSRASLVLIPTIFGRAAIAESRGDFDGSRKYLEEAASLAGERWPRFGEIAKNRIDGMMALAAPVPLPKQADLPVKSVDPVAPPAATDDLFQQLLNEQGAGQAPQGASGDAPALDPAAPAPAPAPAEPGSGG